MVGGQLAGSLIVATTNVETNKWIKGGWLAICVGLGSYLAITKDEKFTKRVISILAENR